MIESDPLSPYPRDIRDRYVPRRLLGRGGFGSVFLAEQVALSRPVAVKVLDPSALEGEEPRARFLEEARITAALRHPQIVQLIECGISHDVPWIVFEYLEGRALRPKADAPLPWPQVRTLGLQLASALACAHERGIVHRDLKPDNMLVLQDGTVKVLDFGIAKWTGDSRVRTATGMVLGTPQYMPPESLRGLESDPRWDVYSLGTMMIELGCGRLPYPTDLAGTFLAKKTDTALGGCLARSSLPQAARQLLATATAADPARRFADGRALHDALAALEAAAGSLATVRFEGDLPEDREPTRVAAVPSVLSQDVTPVTIVRTVPPPRRRTGAVGAGMAVGVAVLFASGWHLSRPAPPAPMPPPSVTSITTEAEGQVPPDFTVLQKFDRRAEYVELAKAGRREPAGPWDTARLDFWFDPRRDGRWPEEALLELSFSSPLPPGAPALLELNGMKLREIPHDAGPTVLVPVPGRHLLPGINHLVIRQNSIDYQLERSLLRLTVHQRGSRVAETEAHFFGPVESPPSMPLVPPDWKILEDLKEHERFKELHTLSLQSIAKDPENPWTHWALASSLRGLGRRTEAMRSFGRASACAVHEMWVFTDTARCLRLMGRGEEAVLLLEWATARARERQNPSCIYWTEIELTYNARDRKDTAAVARHQQRADAARAEMVRLNPNLGENNDVRAMREILSR